MAGAMGGSKSEEFLAHSETGEDTFVKCVSCGLAANVEAIHTRVPADVDSADVPAKATLHTPNTASIKELVDFANANAPRPDRAWQASDTLKNVVLMLTHLDGSQSPLVIGLPGDREVDIKRVEAAVHPATVDTFEDDQFAKFPALVKGYIGPEGLGEKSASGIRYVVDPRVVNGTVWISGANQKDHHNFSLVAGRDFAWDGVIEAAEVREGDECSTCGAPLTIARGIEIGHIFQLGKKYAEALELKVLNEEGKLVTVTMGSYGIGVSRAVATVAEQSHDDKGLIWPREVAPADIHLIATGKDDAAFQVAEKFAQELEAQSVRVLFDDRRGVSPGVKFNDSELLGVPTIVVVGKGLADGVVEVKDRRSGAVESIPVADLVGYVVSMIHASTNRTSSTNHSVSA